MSCRPRFEASRSPAPARSGRRHRTSARQSGPAGRQPRHSTSASGRGNPVRRGERVHIGITSQKAALAEKTICSPSLLLAKSIRSGVRTSARADGCRARSHSSVHRGPGPRSATRPCPRRRTRQGPESDSRARASRPRAAGCAGRGTATSEAAKARAAAERRQHVEGNRLAVLELGGRTSPAQREHPRVTQDGHVLDGRVLHLREPERARPYRRSPPR